MECMYCSIIFAIELAFNTDYFSFRYRCQSVQNLGLAVISLLSGVIVDNGGFFMLEIFFIGWLCSKWKITRSKTLTICVACSGILILLNLYFLQLLCWPLLSSGFTIQPKKATWICLRKNVRKKPIHFYRKYLIRMQYNSISPFNFRMFSLFSFKQFKFQCQILKQWLGRRALSERNHCQSIESAITQQIPHPSGSRRSHRRWFGSIVELSTDRGRTDAQKLIGFNCCHYQGTTTTANNYDTRKM